MLTGLDDPRVLKVVEWAKAQEPKPFRRTFWLKMSEEGINEDEIDDIMSWLVAYYVS